MKILICISHVPDTTTKIQFNDAGTELKKDGVTFVINPYDEFCISRALELREAGLPVEKIDVITVGNAETDATLRKALALSVDDAYRVDLEPKDAYQVAVQLADFAGKNGYDLVMTGKESIDSNGSAVPGMVAELLDFPFVSFATSLEIKGNVATLQREIDGGMEELEIALPLVLSAQKGMAEWRIANMKGIANARRKTITVVPAIATPSFTESVRYELPPAKAGCVYLDPGNVQEVVKILADRGAL